MGVVERLVERAPAALLCIACFLGHVPETLVQAERSLRRSGPLLIRGFRVRAPGAPPTKSQVNAATLDKLPAGVPAKQPGWHQEIHGREMLASHSCPGDLAGEVAAASNR
jgi:hypothetical protein